MPYLALARFATTTTATTTTLDMTNIIVIVVVVVVVAIVVVVASTMIQSSVCARVVHNKRAPEQPHITRCAYHALCV